jgi:drug/metabolite transporter (DMT)-like permease
MNVQTQIKPKSLLSSKGFLYVMIGSIIWGVQGNLAQILFQTYHFTPGWLISTRLIAAGIIFIAILLRTTNTFNAFSIWESYVPLLFFSIFGVFAFQYTFFMAIHASNAAMAALLQFLAPTLILLYYSLRERRRLTKNETMVIFLSIVGMFLLVGNGSFSSLVLSLNGFLWGIGSAIAFFVYTLSPKKLMNDYGTLPVIGWGMFIGGLFSLFFHQPWETAGKFTFGSVSIILFVIALGTVLSFYLYLVALRYILEPFTAIIVSTLFLEEEFGSISLLGGLLILISTFINQSK